MDSRSLRVRPLGSPSDSRARWPRSPAEYARAPRETASKVVDWLSARWQLRACTSVGPWSRVAGRLAVKADGVIRVGERVRIVSTHARTVLFTARGGVLEIGDRTFINYGSDIAATGSVKIGSDCLIGTHVIILDNDFHEVVDRNASPTPRPVLIGDRVWIGSRAIILPGVTVGEGAVVGAGAVVTRDVEPGTIVAGNPARKIGTVGS